MFYIASNRIKIFYPGPKICGEGVVCADMLSFCRLGHVCTRQYALILSLK